MSRKRLRNGDSEEEVQMSSIGFVRCIVRGREKSVPRSMNALTQTILYKQHNTCFPVVSGLPAQLQAQET